MKQTFSIKKKNGKWLIFDNTEPSDIPFDDGGLNGFTQEECIQACINLNSVPESEEEEALREEQSLSFLKSLRPRFEIIPINEESTLLDLLVEEASKVGDSEILTSLAV